MAGRTALSMVDPWDKLPCLHLPHVLRLPFHYSTLLLWYSFLIFHPYDPPNIPILPLSDSTSSSPFSPSSSFLPLHKPIFHSSSSSPPSTPLHLPTSMLSPPRALPIVLVQTSTFYSRIPLSPRGQMDSFFSTALP